MNFLRTFSIYMKNKILTANEEDYIEAIYILSKDQGITKIKILAEHLLINKSSVSNMIKKLKNKEIIERTNDKKIFLTHKGIEIAEFLYIRHQVIEQFLIHLDIHDNILEKVEKIEHTIDHDVLEKISLLNKYLEVYQEHFQSYLKQKIGKDS